MKLRNVRECAEYGDVFYQSLLAMLYWFGAGTLRDKSGAIDLMTRAAEQKSTQAAYALYFMLRERDPRDRSAFEWLQRSANSGFAPAEFLVGASYETGTDVEKNPDQAFVWFKRAVDKGYQPAMHHLALLYLDGIDVPQDQELACRILRDATERGYAHSAQSLGMRLIEKRNDADLKEGLRLIKWAAALDNYAANFFLWTAYSRGLYGVPKDKDLAEMFRLRAERLKTTTPSAMED